MRAPYLSDAALLVALTATANFALFAEEPLLDFTDWNACHVLLLVFAL